MRLALGSPVRCTDAPFGELSDVVIDPISRRVTHLVVAPPHDRAHARLVPMTLVSDTSDGLQLDLTASEAAELELVQDSDYVRLGQQPELDPEHDIGVNSLLAIPLYQDPDGFGTVNLDQYVTVVYDRVPKGEVEIRRSSSVVSADDHLLGTVDGFLISADNPVPDVVLERGHLWGKREVVIPHGAVARVETDAVYLSLTKDQVGELPARRVHRWF
jgi:hypothetical protein